MGYGASSLFYDNTFRFHFPSSPHPDTRREKKGFFMLCVPLPSFSEAVVAFLFQPLLPFYYDAFSLGKEEEVREEKESCDKKK